jgi:hypothetical protein
VGEKDVSTHASQRKADSCPDALTATRPRYNRKPPGSMLYSHILSFPQIPLTIGFSRTNPYMVGATLAVALAVLHILSFLSLFNLDIMPAPEYTDEASKNTTCQ